MSPITDETRTAIATLADFMFEIQNGLKVELTDQRYDDKRCFLCICGSKIDLPSSMRPYEIQGEVNKLAVALKEFEHAATKIAKDKLNSIINPQ